MASDGDALIVKWQARQGKVGQGVVRHGLQWQAGPETASRGRQVIGTAVAAGVAGVGGARLDGVWHGRHGGAGREQDRIGGAEIGRQAWRNDP